MSPTEAPEPNADAARLTRIEAVHRGFLYQHLYCVACILLARRDPAILSVVAEGHEDVEVVLANERRYVQIKQRASPLALSEISSNLNAFVQRRQEHAAGLRALQPKFFIVSSQPASAGVLSDSRVRDLDVRIIGPETEAQDLGMPRAWATVQEALEACRGEAEQVPYTRLDSQTLVWKLATEVALASAGERTEGHEFLSGDIEHLLDILYVRLQRLPAPPEVYRLFEFEPDLASPNRIRLVVAHAGGGKTAWIANRSLYLPERLVYFDVSDNSDSTLPPALAREISAVLTESPLAEELRQTLYAGTTGLASLRAIDLVVKRAAIPLTIVIDNTQRIGARAMHDVVSAIDSASWVLLAQPHPALLELRTRLGCAEESIGGLAIESIAAEFRAAGASATPSQANRVRALTAGLPLFVRDAALLCARRYGNDCEALCAALENALSTETTGQEAILRGTLDHLGDLSRRATGVLVLSAVRLREEEALDVLVDSLEVPKSDAAGSLRQLREWGLLQLFANRDVALHDAFRPVVRAAVALSQEQQARSLRTLASVFRRSFSRGAIERFLAYCRIAPRIGETSEVVDMVGSIPEHLHEHGTAEALYRIMAAAAEDESLADEDRFWATDTLAFWDIQGGAPPEELDRRMQKLEMLLPAVRKNPRARYTVATKRLLVARFSRDIEKVRQAYAAAIVEPPPDTHSWLILRYTYAVALLACRELAAADVVTRSVVKGYLALLGLEPSGLFMKNPREIAEILGERAEHIELLKHMADAIDLRAKVVEASGGSVVLLKMWAFKLYALANAPSSMAKVGQDVVDGLLSIGDVSEARKLLEDTLIPGIAERGLLELLVPLRAQWAVVLAYGGHLDEARRELDEQSTFAAASDELGAELASQRRLVEKIADGSVKLRVSREKNLDRRGMLLDAPAASVGRNEPCVCGSGQKFKRCCGR